MLVLGYSPLFRFLGAQLIYSLHDVNQSLCRLNTSQITSEYPKYIGVALRKRYQDSVPWSGFTKSQPRFAFSPLSLCSITVSCLSVVGS